MYSEERLPWGGARWLSVGAEASTVAADGCVDLILRGDEVVVAGPSTRWTPTHPDDEGGSVGIRYAPGAAAGLLGLDLDDLRDQLVPLSDVTTSGSAERIREALARSRRTADAGDPADDASLVARPSGWACDVRRGARRAVPVHALLARSGWSERTFRRRMAADFGYGYSTLIRIERARTARRALSGGRSLSEAAVHAGYADQPHLTREFQRLVGMTPGQFVVSSA